MEFQKLKIFVDGASRGNPGYASAGVVICNQNGEVLKKWGRTLGVATNNAAEYLALIYALLEAKKLNAEELEVCIDSQLVERQLAGKYKKKNNQLGILFDLVNYLKADFKSVSIKYISRRENKIADEVANMALEKNKDLFF